MLLCDTPIGKEGRPSESLAFDQAEAVLVPSGAPAPCHPVPPAIAVYRSVREDGDTKPFRSRRRLAMPQRCIDALRIHRDRLGCAPASDVLVFASAAGTELDTHNVRRSFHRIVAAAGLNPKDWTPWELRHSFVSLLSASGVRIEDISRLVGTAEPP